MKKFRTDSLVIGILKLCLVLVVVLSFTPSSAFAALATLSQSWSTEDAAEVNRAIYGNEVTFLGTRLIGPLKREASDITGGAYATETVIDPDDRVVFFTTGPTGNGISDSSLADGVPGHKITFVLETDGGGNVDITPTTKTGFTSLQLTDAKDSCTLEYINDTDGWFLASNNGCTIN